MWVGKKLDKHIAEEDITCFKAVFPDLTSLFQDFQYEIGKTYSTELNPEQRVSSIDPERIWIFEGFHYFKNKHEFKKYKGYEHIIVLICKIPKGTIYYENKYGKGVTSKLIVEDAIPIDKFLKQCVGLEKEQINVLSQRNNQIDVSNL